MQAVVWERARNVQVRECPAPDLEQATDAIVRVTHAGICGSDLHLYHHAVPDMHAGDILGHELVGIVERTGAVKLETDSGDVVTQALLAVRKGGNLVLIGDYVGFTNHFPIGAMMEKGVTVRGGQVHVQRYRKLLAELILDRVYDPSFVSSHRLPLRRAADACALFDQKEDGVLKVILTCADGAGAAL